MADNRRGNNNNLIKAVQEVAGICHTVNRLLYNVK